MKLLYWKLYYKLSGLPHKEHIKFLLKDWKWNMAVSHFTRKICDEYSKGWSILEIADVNDVTRERVRQLLRKAML